MASWTPAYNTNGFAHHRLIDAIEILAELGYGGVALTPDVHHLDPFDAAHSDHCLAFKSETERLGLRVTLESGARFNLDPRKKHYPSLLCPQNGQVRLDYLSRCHETALAIGAESISFWSGHNFDGLPDDEAWGLLAERVKELTDGFRGSGVAWGVEPEPGMFLETLDQYQQLCDRVPQRNFGLALDLGHLMVTEERSCEQAIREFADDIVAVAIEDMKRGVHDHLPFGAGDIHFPPIFTALREIGYDGLLAVELSRASSTAFATAEQSIEFLEPFCTA
ncbi:MAG: L-ribulose-5-phosphate 3-epimerase [Planctomycetota bacterium]|jgi:L-ribulose-5-phosphate 3-epimerase